MQAIRPLLGLAAFGVFGLSVAAERTVVHAGTLLLEARAQPLSQATIAIEGDRIVAIEPGYVEPPAFGWTVADRLDLRDCFVMPGLIDLHVHLTTPVQPGGALRTVTETPARLALRGARFASDTLSAGFTTVVDLGSGRLDHELAIYALRDSIATGIVPGPRVLAAGSPLSPTGASRTGRFRADVDAALPPQGVCDGAVECRRVTREQIARGADVINVYISGSLNDPEIAPRTFTDGELAAIVETARELGRVVIGDGHTAAGINSALRAGVDIIDTAPWPDDTSWKLMRERGATFVPHLYAFERVVGDQPDELASGTHYWSPDPVLRRLYDVKRQPPSALRAFREGVPIATGSDTGIVPHGENAGELEALVKMGMPPVGVLEAATMNAARALRIDDEVGSLAVGKSADLIALRASPLDDIVHVRAPVAVMSRGRLLAEGDRRGAH